MFNSKKLSYGSKHSTGNQKDIIGKFPMEMNRKSVKNKKVYSRNNNGLMGNYSKNEEDSRNWGFGPGRFRTQVSMKPSSYYRGDNSTMLNRTMGSQPSKKKRSSETRMHKAGNDSSLVSSHAMKSHSLPKKPKSGRNISRNQPNNGIYSMQPKMSLSYKKRTKTAKNNY